eukprot:s1717_g4.t1
MALWAFVGGSLLAASFVHLRGPGREVRRTTLRSDSVVSPDRPRWRESWKNRVPKAERQESLQEHFRSVQRRQATTTTWRQMDPEPFCRALESIVEASNLEASEELISAKCHKQLRKLTRGMRIGWEWELLNATEDLDGEALAKIDFEAVILRMQSLGPQKQAYPRGAVQQA